MADGSDLLRMLGMRQALTGSDLQRYRNSSAFTPWDPQGVTVNTKPPGGRAAAPVQNMNIPPAGRALLATIGGKGFESNGSYTQRFNQSDFSDFSRHPATLGRITSGPNAGLKSDAAGRYQFLSTTYADQAKKLGLKDFSPASQDAAAWNLAKETYSNAYRGRDLAADLNDPRRLPQIASALRSQWTSLPGGIESRAAIGNFTSAFHSNLQQEVARAPTTPAPSTWAGQDAPPGGNLFQAFATQAMGLG